MKKLLLAVLFLATYVCYIQSLDKITKPISNGKKGQEAFIDDVDIPMLALKITNNSEVDQMYSYHNKGGEEILGVLPPTNMVFIDLATVDLAKGALFGITNVHQTVLNKQFTRLIVTFLNKDYTITTDNNERIEINIDLNNAGSTINLTKSVPAPVQPAA